MMIDTSPWSSCSRQSLWLLCLGHTISSTGPSVSPFRDFYLYSLSESSLLGTSSTLVEMKMSSSFKARFSFAHCRTRSTPTSVCNSSANLSWAPISQFNISNPLKKALQRSLIWSFEGKYLVVILPFLRFRFKVTKD